MCLKLKHLPFWTKPFWTLLNSAIWNWNTPVTLELLIVCFLHILQSQVHWSFRKLNSANSLSPDAHRLGSWFLSFFHFNQATITTTTLTVTNSSCFGHGLCQNCFPSQLPVETYWGCMWQSTYATKVVATAWLNEFPLIRRMATLEIWSKRIGAAACPPASQRFFLVGIICAVNNSCKTTDNKFSEQYLGLRHDFDAGRSGIKKKDH